MSKIPLIIDCDPGIDDLFAIMMMHSCDKYEIKAVTPVGGNQVFEKTTKNALDIVDFIGIDCIVAKGAARTINRRQFIGAPQIHGEAGLGTLNLPAAKRDFDPRYAWDVIYDEAVKANGSLEILAIGPLTNIAIAVTKYPELPKMVKRLVIMGGSSGVGNTLPQAEFNIVCDPEACEMVLGAGFDMTMFGLNATFQPLLDKDFFDGMAAIPTRIQMIFDAMAVDFKELIDRMSERCGGAIHDAIAGAYMIDKSLASVEEFYVTTELHSELMKGTTLIDYSGRRGKKPNCKVAFAVDEEKFKEMMFRMVRFYALENGGGNNG